LRASISASALGRAAQGPQRHAEQVFQQLGLPGVPDLGAGAAHVGHGQQVQAGQPTGVAHLLGKAGHHVGVGQVFLLRHAAHGQVLAHQELDQAGVGLVQPVVAAEAPHLHRAQLGMVAAAPLGHVVEEGGDVEQPGLVPVGRQLAAERVLVGMLGMKKRRTLRSTIRMCWSTV
jgi:hypothetical protein